MNIELVKGDRQTIAVIYSDELIIRDAGTALDFAIYGDFSQYTSKPLKDFIYESNHGRDVFFVDTKERAIALLNAT